MGNFFDCRNGLIRLPVRITRHDILTNRYFKFGIFCQGYPDRIADAVFQKGTDADGRFVRVNRRAEQLWGYGAHELIGVRFIDMVHPDDRPSTAEVAAQIVAGAPVGGHMNRYLCKDGSTIPMMWSATWSETHQTIFAVARDMREHLAADERLRQSQKMAAVGRLTGGVAHDFNNLLTVIIGSTEELTAALSGAPELQALGRLSLEAAERGAELVSRLLAYARNQPLASEPVDCNGMLENLQDLVRSTCT